MKRVNASGADDEGDYEVVLQVSPQGAGTVEGAGMYDENDTAQIKATPAKGYKFVKLSDGVENAERNLSVTDDFSLIAIFEKVDSTSSPTGNGTEGSGSGTGTGSGTSGTGSQQTGGGPLEPMVAPVAPQV